MRRPPRYVTPAEVERIRTLHAEGLTDPQIAARLGLRSSNVCVIRGIRLGLRPNRKCHFWTGREQKLLIELAGEGKSRREIAAALGVAELAVAKRLIAIQLGEELDARRIRSQNRKVRAWDLFAAGAKAPAVALAIGLHEETVRRYKQAMPKDWGQSKDSPATIKRQRL